MKKLSEMLFEAYSAGLQDGIEIEQDDAIITDEFAMFKKQREHYPHWLRDDYPRAEPTDDEPEAQFCVDCRYYNDFDCTKEFLSRVTGKTYAHRDCMDRRPRESSLTCADFDRKQVDE